jgi:hypothetical protein
MAIATGLVLIKRFTYRDDPGEEWSNKYWLTGSPPATATAWRALFDELVALEKQCYPASVHVVGGYAYDDNTPGANSVWSVDLTALAQEVPGTLSTAVGSRMSGDQAGLVEWQTNRKNTRGKWIYLRKYFHSGMLSSIDHDEVEPTTITQYTDFATRLSNGGWPGGRIIRSQKQDEVLQTYRVPKYVTTRTLHRRGKRP